MPSKKASPEAEEIFRRALEELDAGAELDVDALCRDHPAHADELRLLHGNWDVVCGLLGVGEGRAVGDLGVTSELLDRLALRSSSSDRYEVEDEVNRGGQGVVLRVWDQDLRRHLAMKVLLDRETGDERAGSSPHVDTKTLGRFLEEAHVTGQLDHPGVVPVHELGLDPDGRVYFTMKLVQGEDLRTIFERVKSGADDWSLTRALGVLLKLCEAVAYAHSKGVVHRDLKPTNVMVGRFGEVYAMDWGLARVLGREDARDLRIQRPESTVLLTSLRRGEGDTPESPLMTMDGDVVGTPAYMSPEQASGRVDEVGPRSDVYSLGAMLYELLAGQMPYAVDGAYHAHAVWMRVQEGAPRPLAELAPDLPPELEAICERAMERRAEDRYASMLDLARDLRAFLEGRVVRAYRTGALIELRKWIGRNKALATTAAAAAAVVVIASVTTNVVLARKNKEVTEAGDKALAARDEALASGYLASIGAAAGNIAADRLVEARLRLAECPEDLRGWEHRHLSLAADTAVASSTTSAPVGAVAALSDGRFAALDAAGNLTVRRAEDHAELAAFSVDAHPDFPVVAADPAGGWLAYGDADGRVRVLDVETGTTTATIDPAADGGLLGAGRPPVTSLTRGAGGARLAVSTLAGETVVADTTTWSLVARLADTGPLTALGPAGERLACGGMDASLRGTVRAFPWEVAVHERVSWAETGARVVDVVTGEVLEELAVGGFAVTTIAYGPDGVHLGTEDGQVKAFTRAGARIPAMGLPVGLAVQPRGDLLAIGGDNGRVLFMDRGAGGAPTVLAGHAGPARAVTFTADGDQLVVGGLDAETGTGILRTWDLAPQEARTRVVVDRKHAKHEPRSRATWPGLSSGGGRLVFSGAFGRVRILDPLDLTIERALNGPPGDLYDAHVAPDGERLFLLTSDRVSETSGSVLAWDLVDEGRLWRLSFSADERPTRLTLARDGSRVYVGRVDGAILELDARTGELLTTLRGPGAVTCLAWVDELTLLSGTAAGPTAVWDLRSGQAELLDDADAACVGFVAPRLVTGYHDGSLRFWSRADEGWSRAGAEVAGQSVHPRSIVAIEASPAGERWATASLDGTVAVWDVDADGVVLVLDGRTEERRPPPPPGGPGAGGHGQHPPGLHPQDRRGDPQRRPEGDPQHPRGTEADGRRATERMTDVVWSPDGVRLLAVTTTAEVAYVQVWDSEADAARRLWRAEGRRAELESEVEALARDQALVDDTVAALAAREEWDDARRRDAVAVALRQSDPAASSWDRDARASALVPDRREFHYTLALRRAERACHLIWDDAHLLGTLGMAQYRCGLLEEAVATLTRANELGKERTDRADRAMTLYFLAMARAGVGEMEGARAALAAARELDGGGDSKIEAEAAAIVE